MTPLLARWWRVAAIAAAVAAGGATTGAQGGRVYLTADATIYVSPAGTDSPTCGTSPGAACLTPQRAVDNVLAGVDAGHRQVTVALAPGSYPGFEIDGPLVGAGKLVIAGDQATIVGDGRHAVAVRNRATVWISGLTVTTTNGPNLRGVFSTLQSVVNLGPNMVFGAVSGDHMTAAYQSQLVVFSSYGVTGGATTHLHAFGHSTIVLIPGTTVTLQNTPTFAAYFVGASQSEIVAGGVTVVGSATTPSGQCLVHYSSLLFAPGTTLPGAGACFVSPESVRE